MGTWASFARPVHVQPEGLSDARLNRSNTHETFHPCVANVAETKSSQSAREPSERPGANPPYLHRPGLDNISLSGA